MVDDEPLAERARQVLATRGEPVPSPCLSICRMSRASALCEGCFRTLDEIAAWGRMTDNGKRAVWQQIALRLENRLSA